MVTEGKEAITLPLHLEETAEQCQTLVDLAVLPHRVERDGNEWVT